MAAATTAPAATTKPATKKVAKKAAPSKLISSPTYFQMIKEAILALKERSGSSPQAIAKYMEEHYKGGLPGNYKKILGTQLKNSVAKGRLIKIKASFKLSDAAKKEKVPKPAAEKKPKAPKATEKKPKAAAKKPKTVASKKSTSAKPVKKAAVKKAPVKKAGKSTPVKRKAPKSAAAKKAKKV